MTLKEMMAKLKELREKMKTIRGQIDSAKNDEERQTFQKAFDGVRSEFTDLSAKVQHEVELAKEDKAATDAIAAAEELTKTDVRNKGLGNASDVDNSRTHVPGNTNGTDNGAVPVDRQKEIREKEDIFFKFVGGGLSGTLSDREFDALQPRNKELLRSIESKQVVTVPRRVMARIFPGLLSEFGQFSEKALPMTSGDNDAAGGRANLLIPEYGRELRQLPTSEPSFFLRVTKKPVIGGTLIETRLKQDDANEFGGVEVAWTDEEDDAPDTEMEIERVTINCHPAKAYTSFTRTLMLRDRFSLETELVSKLRKAFMALCDRAIVSGTGVKQPIGIRILDGVRTVARLVADTVSYDDFVNVEHAVLPEHRIGATFAVSDSVLKACKKIKDTTGRPIFSATTGSGPYDRLDNWPYFGATRCSAIGTSGDVMFGDFLNYWLAIEEEIVIARSEHAEFKKGGIAIRADALIGGRPMYERAFAILVGVSGS